MTIRTCSIVLLLLLGGALPASGQSSGTLEGTVELPRIARKWASRYPGAGASTGEVQAVAPLVWLSGDLPGAGSPDTVAIDQRERLFSPSALVVPTGSLVRFPNEDPFYHNVFSYSGPRFDLGRYAPGTSREVVLDRPGLVLVFCEIHEFMRAVILVADHAFATVAGDGTYRISGVPPGTYTLSAFHPDHGRVDREITVTAGVTRADLVLGQ